MMSVLFPTLSLLSLEYINMKAKYCNYKNFKESEELRKCHEPGEEEACRRTEKKSMTEGYALRIKTLQGPKHRKQHNEPLLSSFYNKVQMVLYPVAVNIMNSERSLQHKLIKDLPTEKNQYSCYFLEFILQQLMQNYILHAWQYSLKPTVTQPKYLCYFQKNELPQR